jgi:ABC-type sugar transport system substrate-binding protein
LGRRTASELLTRDAVHVDPSAAAYVTLPPVTEAPADGTEAPADSAAAGGETGETIRIVASVPPTDHGWLGQIAAKAQEAADQFDDVDFRLLEAADADSQASQIQTVINEKPDALVVLPYDGGPTSRAGSTARAKWWRSRASPASP